ncbi:MAG: hypothetical protein IJX74_05875 [Clostridia bacterium]|nr:hypothetical protein [Clostridia bacterium]
MFKKIQITEYNLKGKLPDPFEFDDGGRVKDAADWERRREEIFKSAVELQYGAVVPEPTMFEVEPLYVAGVRRPNVYKITAGTLKKTVSFTMTVFKAATDRPLPTVVTGDLCFQYAFDKEYLDAFLNNEINLALFNRTELFPDVAHYNEGNAVSGSEEREMLREIADDFDSGIRRGPLAEVYPDVPFGAISAWAWGYSRCVDALEQLGFADMSCIAFTGHSRGGKVAILAGALDKRATVVNPNATCAGGCSCYRLNIKAVCEDGVTEAKSEPLSNIFYHFPTWLGEGMREYIGREDELPFDSHYLKAMVAPRVLFVSEAASDIMANPVGSWQTTMGAGEVYKFLGKEENLLWYYRSGGHAQTVEDVTMLVNVIRHVKWGEPLCDKYFKAPFDEPELAFDWRG